MSILFLKKKYFFSVFLIGMVFILGGCSLFSNNKQVSISEQSIPPQEDLKRAFNKFFNTTSTINYSFEALDVPETSTIAPTTTKFFLWVIAQDESGQTTEGAARITTVNSTEENFQVINFFKKENIEKDFVNVLREVFPPHALSEIRKKIQ